MTNEDEIVTQYDGFILREQYYGFAAEVEFPEGVTKFRGRHACQEAKDYVQWILERRKRNDGSKSKNPS
jgi:hypothetical protein